MSLEKVPQVLGNGLRWAQVLPQEVWWVTDEMSIILKKDPGGAQKVHQNLIQVLVTETHRQRERKTGDGQMDSLNNLCRVYRDYRSEIRD